MKNQTKLGFMIALLLAFLTGLTLSACQPESGPSDASLATRQDASVPTAKQTAPGQKTNSKQSEGQPSLTQSQTIPPATLSPTTILTPTPAYGEGSSFISPVDEMTLLFVPAGKFRMGITRQEYITWNDEAFAASLHGISNEDDETPQQRGLSGCVLD